MATRSFWALLTCLLITSGANAQCISLDDVDPATLSMNQKADDAAQVEGDFKKAERLLRSSLDVEETNLTWLNFGYVLSQQGKCDEALKAFEQVRTTRKVCEVPVEAVDEALAQFEADLPNLCPGHLAFTCKPASMLITIERRSDGKITESIPCPQRPYKVDRGEYEIKAMYGSKTTTYVTSVVGLKTAAVNLEIEVAFDTQPALHASAIAAAEGALRTKKLKKKDPGVDPAPGISGLAIGGWTTLGIGALALVGSVIVDVAVIAPDVDTLKKHKNNNDLVAYDKLAGDVESLQTVNLALLIGGGTLAVVGAVLLIVDATSAPSGSESSTDNLIHDPVVNVFVGPDNAGVMLQGRW